MTRPSRRRMLGVAFAGASAALLGRHFLFREAGAAPASPSPALKFEELEMPADSVSADRFLRWLRKDGASKERRVRNLIYNFYDVSAAKGTWLYPMLSGKAILWFIDRGLVDEANAIAATLLRWQQTSKQGALAKSYGAFSSMLEQKDGSWTHGQRFYSGDNLVILAALIALYDKTKNSDLLNSAVGIGTWLTEVMCKGHKHGVWAEDHGAPMQFVTLDGNFSNNIHTSVEMLWLPALNRLGDLTKEAAYKRQAARATDFLRRCQAASGAYLDAYDPAYPPKPYDPGRWRPFQAGQVIGDNMLRTALGLCRMGDLGSARKFYNYLKVESGGVPGYLNVDTGQHGFPAGARVYYDVTSSALHRSLCQWLNERAAAEADMAFLRSVQHTSGGWPWGVWRDDRTPVEPKLAPVVGFWATADLSTLGV